MKKTIFMAENIYLIDDFDLGLPQRTGSYFLDEEELTIIETCTSRSIPYILEGLKELGKSPEDVKYIIVTHIHLDHAGGAGLLLSYCPNAKVIVHPKGARHLANPEKLIAGAKAVYGERFDELFHPVLPVPEEKILIKDHDDTLQIGQDCTLSFFDTPGHANHHMSIYDEKRKLIFTGDTAGVSYPQLKKYGAELFLPSTSPNQFDPIKMLDSIGLYEGMEVESIYFGHFGATSNPEEVYRQIRYWLPIFLNETQKVFSSMADPKKGALQLKNSLYTLVSESLRNILIPKNDDFFTILNLDLSVSSMGLIDYFTKLEIKKQKETAL